MVILAAPLLPPAKIRAFPAYKMNLRLLHFQLVFFSLSHAVLSSFTRFHKIKLRHMVTNHSVLCSEADLLLSDCCDSI